MKEIVHICSGPARSLTSTGEYSEERRSCRFAAIVIIFSCFAHRAHVANDWRWHGRSVTIWFALFILFILVPTKSVWMLPVCSAVADGNVNLSRVGRELARCKHSGYLPLLRTISNKSRRRRYHVTWALCLGPSLLLSISASLPLSVSAILLWHSRCRYLTLVLTLYVY